MSLNRIRKERTEMQQACTADDRAFTICPPRPIPAMTDLYSLIWCFYKCRRDARDLDPEKARKNNSATITYNQLRFNLGLASL
jgi:hypothetical protein